MTICNKCGNPIESYEPCFKIGYGFNSGENSFLEDDHLIVHLECMNDSQIYDVIIERIRKN